MFNEKEFKICKMKQVHLDETLALSKSILGTGTKDEFQKTLESDVLEIFVLENFGHVVGFFECKIISPEAELYDIAVAKEFQGQGLGLCLMNFFVELCLDRSCETIFLEVNNINKKAISLYEKVGFEKYSIRKNYYGENDAILMKKDLKNNY